MVWQNFNKDEISLS